MTLSTGAKKGAFLLGGISISALSFFAAYAQRAPGELGVTMGAISFGFAKSTIGWLNVLHNVGINGYCYYFLKATYQHISPTPNRSQIGWAALLGLTSCISYQVLACSDNYQHNWLKFAAVIAQIPVYWPQNCISTLMIVMRMTQAYQKPAGARYTSLVYNPIPRQHSHWRRLNKGLSYLFLIANLFPLLLSYTSITVHGLNQLLAPLFSSPTAFVLLTGFNWIAYALATAFCVSLKDKHVQGRATHIKYAISGASLSTLLMFGAITLRQQTRYDLSLTLFSFFISMLNTSILSVIFIQSNCALLVNNLLKCSRLLQPQRHWRQQMADGLRLLALILIFYLGIPACSAAIGLKGVNNINCNAIFYDCRWTNHRAINTIMQTVTHLFMSYGIIDVCDKGLNWLAHASAQESYPIVATATLLPA